MKAIMVLALAAVLGFLVWQKFLKAAPPPPPPPPPPPAILSEPAPVLSDAELQKVIKSASDSEPSVRWESVVYLDKVKAPQAMPLMFEMLQHDQEPDVRTKIINLLGGRSGPDVLRALLGATKDQEADVRLAALKALDRIGDDSVASAIADGPLRDQDEKVREQAMKTLNSLQDRRNKKIADEQRAYEQEKQRAAAAASAANGGK
jgi:HEAT repeat protein